MKRVLAVALLTTFVVTGCAARSVRVSELKGEPGRYATKNVSITGVVTSSWGLPLVPFQLYNIDDGSGEITVVAKSNHGAPAKGTRVRVRGKVNEFATFGGRSIGMHLQEENRSIKS